jgi:hypothetical protein
MRWTCTDPIFRFFKGLEQVPEASVGEFTRHARKMAQYCQETMKRGGLRQYSLKRVIQPYGAQMWVNVIDNGLGSPLILGKIELSRGGKVLENPLVPGLFLVHDEYIIEPNSALNIDGTFLGTVDGWRLFKRNPVRILDGSYFNGICTGANTTHCAMIHIDVEGQWWVCGYGAKRITKLPTSMTDEIYSAYYGNFFWYIENQLVGFLFLNSNENAPTYLTYDNDAKTWNDSLSVDLAFTFDPSSSLDPVYRDVIAEPESAAMSIDGRSILMGRTNDTYSTFTLDPAISETYTVVKPTQYNGIVDMQLLHRETPTPFIRTSTDNWPVHCYPTMGDGCSDSGTTELSYNGRLVSYTLYNVYADYGNAAIWDSDHLPLLIRVCPALDAFYLLEGNFPGTTVIIALQYYYFTSGVCIIDGHDVETEALRLFLDLPKTEQHLYQLKMRVIGAITSDLCTLIFSSLVGDAQLYAQSIEI